MFPLPLVINDDAFFLLRFFLCSRDCVAGELFVLLLLSFVFVYLVCVCVFCMIMKLNDAKLILLIRIALYFIKAYYLLTYLCGTESEIILLFLCVLDVKKIYINKKR